MGLRINTNVASLAAQHALGQSSRKTEKVMMSLATGSKFAAGGRNADFAIGEHLRGQLGGLKAAKMNAENANSFIQVAEGGLNEQNNILIRMRELAIQSASDTFSDTEREMLQLEFDQLHQEVERIAETTSFGSQKLLKGESKEYEFHVGAYGGQENIIKYDSNTDTTADGLGIAGLSVEDKSGARDSLETIDEALTEIGKARAKFGAMQSRLESVTNNAGVQIQNVAEAHSRIADTDFAEAVSEMAKQQALQQYQIAVLSQANQYPGSVMKLIA